jgi:hypothetical protein
VASKGCDAGGRCHIAKTVVEDGGKICGFWLAIDVFLGDRCYQGV